MHTWLQLVSTKSSSGKRGAALTRSHLSGSSSRHQAHPTSTPASKSKSSTSSSSKASRSRTPASKTPSSTRLKPSSSSRSSAKHPKSSSKASSSSSSREEFRDRHRESSKGSTPSSSARRSKPASSAKGKMTISSSTNPKSFSAQYRALIEKLSGIQRNKLGSNDAAIADWLEKVGTFKPAGWELEEGASLVRKVEGLVSHKNRKVQQLASKLVRKWKPHRTNEKLSARSLKPNVKEGKAGGSRDKASDRDRPGKSPKPTKPSKSFAELCAKYTASIQAAKGTSLPTTLAKANKAIDSFMRNVPTLAELQEKSASPCVKNLCHWPGVVHLHVLHHHRHHPHVLAVSREDRVWAWPRC